MPLRIGEVETFPINLNFQGSPLAEVEITLETIAGEGWKTALCYETNCFMHEGKTKLVRTIALTAGTAFEIKMFVPQEALSGQSNTVRMTVAPVGSPSQIALIDLVGFIP